MASAPMPASDPTAAPDAGADAGTDDTGAMPDAGDADDNVVVTIALDPNGGWIVYAGDEPDEGESEDDAEAASAGPAEAPGGAGGGQHVDSIGAALKAAMDIMNEAQNSAGEPGSSEDQFTAGFGADKSPTPAPAKAGRLKYPPAAAA